MSWLRDLSVTRKLSLGTSLASGIALLLTCAAFVSLNYLDQRRSMERRLEGVADILAYNAAAALEFGQREGAEDVLSALRLQQDVVGARIFAVDGAPFADYLHMPDGTLTFPDTPPQDRVTFGGRYLVVARSITAADERIGSIYLRADRRALDEATLWNALITVGLTVVCIFVSMALAALVQGSIAGPILDLARVARTVSSEHDYSRRATKHGNDELGALVDDFNEMLRRIELERKPAELAVTAKTNFLANMSHEIRTPMTAILGFTEELLEIDDPSEVSDEWIEALQAIQRNGDHLVAIINDILDLSKIEAGRMELERLRFSPMRITEEAVSLLKGRADAKGLELITSYGTGIPETIEGDPTRLNQVLLNLLGNAIKFTEAGKVILEVSLLSPEEHPRIRIDVVDTGVGISEEDRLRLFRPFEQLDNSTSRKHGGTGLGLTICASLIDLMSGSINVESEPGRGSRFRVELPTGSLEGFRIIEDPCTAARGREFSSERETEISTLPPSCRILVAEDSPDSQRLLGHVLRRAGADVFLVGDGRAAVESAIASQDEGRPFDIILMDMQMPVLDGYQATRTLRVSGYTGPIFALTAHAMEGEEDRCLRAGCDAYETKPIDRRRLIEKILRYLADSKEPAESGVG